MIRDQVTDDPDDRRTWDEDQHWSAMSVERLRREVSGYSSKKLRRMLKYYRAFGFRKHRNAVVGEIGRRKQA